MLIVFRSKASANVMMLQDLTVRLLDILDKELTPQGIFTIEQLPLAIQKLEAAIASDAKSEAQEANREEEKSEGMREDLRLAQRAYPLLDMLRRALKKGEPVVWQILTSST